MIKTVNSCYYCDKKNKVEWKMYSHSNKAVISKKSGLFSKKKVIDIDYLKNLDIFFNDFQSELCESVHCGKDKLSGDFLTVEIENVKYQLCNFQDISESGKKLLSDIQKYLRLCYENTPLPKSISCHSFDGGGPDYNFETLEKGVFTWYSQKHYFNPNHDKMCGSGFEVIFSLYPLRNGTATGILTGESPICPEPPQRITVKVDNNLNLNYKIESEKPYRL